MAAERMSFRPSLETTQLLKAMSNLLTKPELAVAAGKGADIIADEARRLAPEGPTGNLKRGIVARVDKVHTEFGGGHEGHAYVSVNYKIAPHAHLVEYGARGGEMPANPFMRRAQEAKEAEAVSAIDHDLQQRINLRFGAK